MPYGSGCSSAPSRCCGSILAWPEACDSSQLCLCLLWREAWCKGLPGQAVSNICDPVILQVAVYGMRGLQGKDYAMELDLDEEILYGHQAVAFVVMAPGRPIPAQAMPAHLRSSDSTTPD